MMFRMLTFSHRRKSLPRVEDPTDKVVNRFGLGESLMTTFMCDNPETGCKETGEESIERPDRELGEGVEMGAWKSNLLWSNERVKVLGSLPNATNSNQVTKTR